MPKAEVILKGCVIKAKLWSVDLGPHGGLLLSHARPLIHATIACKSSRSKILVHLPLDIQKLSQKLFLDQSSPTGLRWKVDHWKMKAGDVAGTIKNTGHCIVNFYGQRFHAHRIVWALYHQRDPGEYTVDHIDRNPANNDPRNLRLATYEGQLLNTRNRKSRYGRGVKKVGNRYYARMVVNGKDVSLGGFSTAEEALSKAQSSRQLYLQEQQSILYPNL